MLESASRKAGEELFARNVRVLRLELNAWIAQVTGQGVPAVALMNQAAALEAATPKAPVTPAPTLPADELLGDMLMEQHRAPEALVAYTRSMALYPNRFNGLFRRGAGGARRRRSGAGAPMYAQLLTVAKDGTRQPALREAQRYVDRRP